MLDFMNELFNKFIDFVLQYLPTSPFSGVIDELEGLPFLGYLNWFIPVARLIEIGGLWLAAITLFYFYQIILRWIKAIE